VHEQASERASGRWASLAYSLVHSLARDTTAAPVCFLAGRNYLLPRHICISSPGASSFRASATPQRGPRQPSPISPALLLPPCACSYKRRRDCLILLLVSAASSSSSSALVRRPPPDMASVRVLEPAVVGSLRAAFAISSLAQAVEELVCNGTPRRQPAAATVLIRSGTRTYHTIRSDRCWRNVAPNLV